MVTHTLYSPPGFGVSLYGISCTEPWRRDRKSTRLNSSHGYISYAVFCLKKKSRKLPLRYHRNVRELAHLVTVRLDHPAVLYLRQVRHDAPIVTGTIRIFQSARPGVPSLD